MPLSDVKRFTAFFVAILKTLAATAAPTVHCVYDMCVALLITCCRSDRVNFGEVIIRMKLVFIGEESLNVFLF